MNKRGKLLVEEELFKALVIVQQIGEVYSKTILDAQLEGLE